jgi:alpha-tubulin suppressor-like RCC1 family protein
LPGATTGGSLWTWVAGASYASQTTLLRSDGVLFANGTQGEIGLRVAPDAFAILAPTGNEVPWAYVEGDGSLVLARPQREIHRELNRQRVISATRSASLTHLIRDARADAPPSLLLAPTGQSIRRGESLRLDVAASGTRLRYQWYRGEVPVGEDAPSLAITAAGVAAAGEYRVRIFNHLGELNPPPVSVRVGLGDPAPEGLPPLVLESTAAARQIVAPGAEISFEVRPSLAGPMTYRWSKDGRVLPAQDGPVLSRLVTGQADAGLYAVRAATSDGRMAVKIFRIDVPTTDPVVLVWGRAAGDGSFEPPVLNQAALNLALSRSSGALGLVVRVDGSLGVWGTSSPPVLANMSGLIDVVAESGSSFAGLRLDGTAVGNESSSAPAPGDDAIDLVKIVSGGDGFLGLKSDGRVVKWGTGIAGAPGDLPPAVDIAATYSAGSALLADGTVRSWAATSPPEVPADLHGVVSIAATEERFLALRENGRVSVWAERSSGAVSNPPEDLAEVVSVHGAGNEMLARRGDNTLVRWGTQDGGFAAVPAAAAGAPRWIFASDRAGALVSRGAVAPPRIVQAPPSSIATTAGREVAMQVVASGDQMRYQWFFAGQAIEGARQSQYRFLAGQERAGLYSVRVSNPAGVQELFVDVAVSAARTTGFRTRPAPVTVISEGSVLRLGATPAPLPPPLTYTWRRDGVRLDGFSGSVLALPAARRVDEGLYSLTVVAGDGSQHVTLIRVRVRPARQDPALAIWRAGVPPAGLVAPLALAAGDGFFLGLNEDGVAHAWGTGAAVTQVPPGLDQVVALAAGGAHALALKADGSVVAWGGNLSGEATVPSGLNEVVSIAADGAHSLALRRDGTVVAWGAVGAGVVPAPVGAGGFIDIAVSATHALALRTDGRVVAWGQSGSGQDAVPVELSGVRQIAAGAGISYALLADGSVRRWGSASGSWPAEEIPVVRLVARGSQVAGLRGDGTFATWSSPASWRDYRQVRQVAVGVSDFAVYGDTVAPAAPVITRGLQDSIGWIDGAAQFSVEATGVGLTYEWRREGVLIVGAGPVLNVGLLRSTSLFGTYTVVVRNARGEATSSARLVQGELPSLFTRVPPPRQILPIGSALTLSVETAAPAPLEYRWFHEGRRIPGANGPELRIPSVGIAQAGLYAVGVVDGSGARSVALSMVRVRGTAALAMRFASEENAWAAEEAHAGGPYQAIVLGSGGGVGLRLDGSLRAWGLDMPEPEFGREVLAFGGNFRLTDPAVVALTLSGDLLGVSLRPFGSGVRNLIPSSLVARRSGTDIVDLRLAQFEGLYLRSNGSLVSSSTVGPRFLRVDNVVRILSGDSHFTAIDMDGRPHVFGSDFLGRLSMPADLRAVKDLAIGTSHSVAVRPDGTVVAWGGANAFGQITVPEGLSDVVRVAAGRFFSLAWRADGSVVQWGRANRVGDLAAGAPDGALISVGGGAAAVVFEAPDLAPPRLEAVVGGGFVRPGSAVSFEVDALGAELSYQWFWNGAPIADATTARLDRGPATPTHNGVYSVRVMNPAGMVWSEGRTLRVVSVPVLPEGGELVFGVGAQASAVMPFFGDGSPVVEALELPAWASFDPATARLSGSPPDLGPLHYRVRLQVGNAVGDRVANDYTIRAPSSFAGWRTRYFTVGELADDAVSGPGATPSGDGVPNLLKYALGVPPRSALAEDASEPEESSRLRLRYHRPVNRVDIRYSPERGTDLVDWSEEGLVHELIDQDPLTGWQSWRARSVNEAGDPPVREFLRVRASLIEGGAE